MNRIHALCSLHRPLTLVTLIAIATALSAGSSPNLLAQSLTYSSGQPVSPAFEGWEEDKDGTKYFVFGYMNKNWEEELNVPIGPENNFSPGDADRGQPTHFLPRRNRFVFRVRVPQGFTEKDELVWTLTTHGRTTKAYASLRADYMIDDVVKASETGALGAGTSNPTVRANKPPTVRVEGSKTLRAKVGEPVTIVASIADDGVPRARSREEFLAVLARRAASSPFGAALGAGAGAGAGASAGAGAGRNASSAAPSVPTTEGERPSGAGSPSSGGVPPALAARLFTMPPNRITVGKNLGLHLSWFVYRGVSKVQFEPAQIKAWEDTRAGANSPWAPIWFAPPLPSDGKITTQVRFDTPGTYVLRALADDGALTAAEDVTIVVTGATSTR